jgi:hypothetical protein
MRSCDFNVSEKILQYLLSAFLNATKGKIGI